MYSECTWKRFVRINCTAARVEIASCSCFSCAAAAATGDSVVRAGRGREPGAAGESTAPGFVHNVPRVHNWMHAESLHTLGATSLCKSMEVVFLCKSMHASNRKSHSTTAQVSECYLSQRPNVESNFEMSCFGVLRSRDCARCRFRARLRRRRPWRSLPASTNHNRRRRRSTWPASGPYPRRSGTCLQAPSCKVLTLHGGPLADPVASALPTPVNSKIISSAQASCARMRTFFTFT